ncbi:hypothetical protein [Nocardia sp. NPDC058480]
MALDYDDRTDFENADRGFIKTLTPMRITKADGTVIFDTSGFGFLDGP